jgi:hypothetical protein
MSPAAKPSDSCSMSNRNTASRVGCANAEKTDKLFLIPFVENGGHLCERKPPLQIEEGRSRSKSGRKRSLARFSSTSSEGQLGYGPFPLLRFADICNGSTTSARPARSGPASQRSILRARLRRSLSEPRLIVGWDFDGRIRLRPDVDAAESPPVGELLHSLVEARPELEVRILVWSLAIAHAPGAVTPLLLGAAWQAWPDKRSWPSDRLASCVAASPVIQFNAEPAASARPGRRRRRCAAWRDPQPARIPPASGTR